MDFYGSQAPRTASEISIIILLLFFIIIKGA